MLLLKKDISKDISYSHHQRKTKDTGSITYNAHLLLQGDSFLTSRFNPPNRIRVLKTGYYTMRSFGFQKRMVFRTMERKRKTQEYSAY
jgi:hypothetical protein